MKGLVAVEKDTTETPTQTKQKVHKQDKNLQQPRQTQRKQGI